MGWHQDLSGDLGKVEGKPTGSTTRTRVVLVVDHPVEVVPEDLQDALAKSFETSDFYLLQEVVILP